MHKCQLCPGRVPTVAMGIAGIAGAGSNTPEGCLQSTTAAAHCPGMEPVADNGAAACMAV
jgi:hypothetical protein